MRRATLVFAMFTLLALVGAPPALGVWGGEIDNGSHPMVGAIYADFNADTQITWDELACSGSYAGPSKDGASQVFLTAAHCVAWAPSAGIDTLYVSFDEDPQGGNGIPEGLIGTSVFVWDERYGHDWGNLYDSAVLLLPAESVAGIDPVQMPPAGYLDGLKRSGELQHMAIELAGYGVVPEWHQPGGTQFFFDGVRRTGSAEVTGLMRPWLRFQQNTNATGLGGICYGDSGSPNLLPGTRMVLSTTTGVAGVGCNAFGLGYRLDTPWAREFLGQFLVLPS